MFNRFGATAAMVLEKFALGGYTPVAADFGGPAAIESEIDDAVEQVIQAMPAMVRTALINPELMMIEARASTNQLTATLKFKPVIAGKVHIWTGQPSIFVSRPILLTDPWRDGNSYVTMLNSPTPPGATVEIGETLFSVAVATGAVTLVNPLNRNDQVYASYEVDIENAAYSMPSLANLVVNGASAVLGAKVYPQASSQWEYVTRLNEAWTTAVAGLASGEWVPAELRTALWWKAPEPAASDVLIGSVRRYRA